MSSPVASLITMEEAIAHLRLDLVTGDDREFDLEMKMYAAEGIIIDYLKYRRTDWNNETVPGPVKASILIMLSVLWENREGAGPGDYLEENGVIARLLRRLRDPAWA